jgi:hypothetical protein
MRSTGKNLRIFFVIISTGLALWVVLEHRALASLEQENRALHGRLTEMNQIRVENQRLADLAGGPSDSRVRGQPGDSAPVEPEQKQELARLRSEVEALREQGKELETVRADTRQVRAAAETALKSRNSIGAGTGSGTAAGSPSQFEVLSADYGTEKTNMDVAAELRERIRADSLKAIASNNLKGDPDFGTVKHLTVVYRVGDKTLTNQFQEGDYVVLPKEPN